MNKKDTFLAPIALSSPSIEVGGDVNGDGLADLFVDNASTYLNGQDGVEEPYVVFSTEEPPLNSPLPAGSTTYTGYVEGGDGANAGQALPLLVGDSRMAIDYADDDSVEHSFEIVTVHRDLHDLNNLPCSFLNIHASTYWEWSTDRQNWSDATFTFKYLDLEIFELDNDEAHYTVYSALSKDGPWIAHKTTVEPARNIVSITVSADDRARYFAVSDHDPDNEHEHEHDSHSGFTCFFVSATYGTAMASELDGLRAVRDTHLLTNPAGHAFTDTYYRLSPPAADYIAQHPIAKNISLAILTPLLMLTHLNTTLLTSPALIIIPASSIRRIRNR